jgi:hypothetical protein
MNTTHDNNLSRIEREYVSFLYDSARRTSNRPVTISEIQEYINTPDGQKGLVSFKAMSMQRRAKEQSSPRRMGEFL